MGRSVPAGPGATQIGSCATSWWYAARLVWLARNGEVPAEENEVSERGFKLTLAVASYAAAVGQRFASLLDALARYGRRNDRSLFRKTGVLHMRRHFHRLSDFLLELFCVCCLLY